MVLGLVNLRQFSVGLPMFMVIVMEKDLHGKLQGDLWE